MKPGNYVFYAIQYRKIRESPWCKPNAPLQLVKVLGEWYICGESWAHSLNPHIGTGNNWRPVNKKAEAEIWSIESNAESYGWYSLKYAIAALKRVRKDDENGQYDYRDGYGRLEQAIRYEYRIVKVVKSYQCEVTPLTVDDIVDGPQP